MRKLRFGILLILSALTFSFPTYAVTPKAGAACTKFGATTTYNNYKYNCIKSYGKLVWVKGAKIGSTSKSKSTVPSKTPTNITSKPVTKNSPTPSPTATPLPSPTPSASATPSPTPVPSQSATATPSPTPAPSQSATATSTASSAPSASPAPSPTPTPSTTASLSPTPTPTPSSTTMVNSTLIPEIKLINVDQVTCELEITNYSDKYSWSTSADSGSVTNEGKKVLANIYAGNNQLTVTITASATGVADGKTNYTCKMASS